MNDNNTLLKLNDFLFQQLERLNNDSLNEAQLESELRRTDAIVDTGKTIIAGAEVVLKAYVAKGDKINMDDKLPKLLSGGSNEQ